jgi:hypothetical protein
MGYTHYFRMPENFTNDEWDDFIARCLNLYNQLPDTIKLAREWDTPELGPEFNEAEVRFNGVGDEGHETFLIQREGNDSFQFCKTAYKPYDLMVCACLIALKESAPQCRISSDGGPEDWKGAFNFYNQAEKSNITFVDVFKKEKN